MWAGSRFVGIRRCSTVFAGVFLNGVPRRYSSAVFELRRYLKVFAGIRRCSLAFEGISKVEGIRTSRIKKVFDCIKWRSQISPRILQMKKECKRGAQLIDLGDIGYGLSIKFLNWKSLNDYRLFSRTLLLHFLSIWPEKKFSSFQCSSLELPATLRMLETSGLAFRLIHNDLSECRF